jgi:hypothetical protein
MLGFLAVRGERDKVDTVFSWIFKNDFFQSLLDCQ